MTVLLRVLSRSMTRRYQNTSKKPPGHCSGSLPRIAAASGSAVAALDRIVNQRRKNSSYAINVDSKSALLAIANKHSTHPLAVDTRRKTIELRTTTSITFHWIKGHTRLKGNERADYLAKTVASYNPVITHDAIPVSRGKQLLEDCYT